MNLKNIKLTSRKLIVGGAAAVAFVALAAAGGYAVSAGDDDKPIPAADRAQADEAALAEAGGGRVTDSELDDEDSKYEVEVTLDDGSQVDVQLDESFDVVSSETDGPEDDGDDRALSDAERTRAEEAALAETGGGTVTDAEADANGYEVEVTLDDGTEVDVRLDGDFAVVSATPDDRDDDRDDD